MPSKACTNPPLVAVVAKPSEVIVDNLSSVIALKNPKAKKPSALTPRLVQPNLESKAKGFHL